jgi:Gamma tubulin complex component N-terminal
MPLYDTQISSPDYRHKYSPHLSCIYTDPPFKPVLSNKAGILTFLNALANSASEDPSTTRHQALPQSYMSLQPIPPIQTFIPPHPQLPSSPTSSLKPKAAFLATSRRAIEPSERDLLRDIPYLLLGLPSTHFPLRDKALSLPTTLPAPIISLLYSLAEPGLLYKSLQTFIVTEESLTNDNVGLVGQSLRGAIKAELAGWMNHVAGIESEIRQYLLNSTDTGGVTLKRCVILVREGTLGLRLMSVIVEDTQGHNLITIIG